MGWVRNAEARVPPPPATPPAERSSRLTSKWLEPPPPAGSGCGAVFTTARHSAAQRSTQAYLYQTTALRPPRRRNCQWQGLGWAQAAAGAPWDCGRGRRRHRHRPATGGRVNHAAAPHDPSPQLLQYSDGSAAPSVQCVSSVCWCARATGPPDQPSAVTFFLTCAAPGMVPRAAVPLNAPKRARREARGPRWSVVCTEARCDGGPTPSAPAGAWPTSPCSPRPVHRRAARPGPYPARHHQSSSVQRHSQRRTRGTSPPAGW